MKKNYDIDYFKEIKRNKRYLFDYIRQFPEVVAGIQKGSVGKGHYRFDCPFCDGQNTGTVFDTNGNWGVNCYRCENFKGDLASIVSFNEGIKGKELTAYLSELVDGGFRSGKFSFDKSNFKSIEKISVNRNLIQELFKFQKKSTTELYGFSIYAGKVTWLFDYLIKLLDLAEDKTKNEDEIFTAALCEFGGRRDAIKLYLTRLGGLMEIADIPDALLAKQETFRKKNGNKNLISAHYMPLWTKEMIIKGINVIIEASEFGITTDNCTKRQIEAHYGIEGVNRVFHGETTRKVPTPAANTLTMDAKKAADLIKEIENMGTSLEAQKTSQVLSKIDPMEIFASLRDEKNAIDAQLKPLNRKLKAGKNVTWGMVEQARQFKNRKITVDIEMKNVKFPVDFCSDEELQIRIANHYSRNSHWKCTRINRIMK